LQFKSILGKCWSKLTVQDETNIIRYEYSEYYIWNIAWIFALAQFVLVCIFLSRKIFHYLLKKSFAVLRRHSNARYFARVDFRFLRDHRYFYVFDLVNTTGIDVFAWTQRGYAGNRGAVLARVWICIHAIAQQRATTRICIRDEAGSEDLSENGPCAESSKYKDGGKRCYGVDGLITRWFAYRTETGRVGWALSQSLYIQSNTLAFEWTDVQEKRERERRGREREWKGESTREWTNGHWLTTTWVIWIWRAAGTMVPLMHNHPRTAVLQTPPGKLHTRTIQYWPWL